MVVPSWDPAAAIAACPAIPWQGHAWRMHKQRYDAISAEGSLRVSGRYHRGGDHFPPAAVFAALYLALAPEVCLGEILRHVTPALLPLLNGYRITAIAVAVTAVADCRDLERLRLTPDALWHDTDYRLPQALAAAAVAAGREGMLVPSATRLGDNLILFPDNLRAASHLAVIDSRDPVLYVARDAG